MKKVKLFLASIFFIGSVLASDITLTAGKDYTVIGKVATPIVMTPGKVNITEFFSYACYHCAVLEPKLDAWLKTIKNVELDQIQVVWEDNFKNLARINATSKLLKLGPNFNQAVFDAIMNKRLNLEDPKVLKTFLTEYQKANPKFNPKTFMSNYNSFSVSSKPAQYAEYTKAYNITGTPTFIIANKYVTEPAQPEKLVQVIQALVDKAKKEQKIK